MNDKYLTVTAITKYIKYRLDSDDNLKNVFIKGEISNCKWHTTGHIYFSIKDENCLLNAIMFSANAKKLTFIPSDGMKVLIAGRISVFEASGRYQIYVDEMLEDGVGNLYIEFEKLKKRLEEKGLFDQKYKKPIPKIPSRIGIITAPTGAAIRDILSTIARRFPICETYLFPSLVQGESASKELVEKLLQADSYNLDVIIIGRGGGSIEDLWAFNDEELAHTIFNAKTPIISAVGHEIDFTISDFVSDLRAPTPTGAAELAVPNMSDILINLEHIKIRLNENLNKKLEYNKLLLNNLKNSFVLKNPMILYENKKQTIDLLQDKINTIITYKLDKHTTNFSNMISKLELLNPLSILSKGYSVVYKDNNVIKNVNEISKNDIIDIKLNIGKFKAKVEEIEK